MEKRTEIVSMQIEDNTIVKVEASSLGGEEDVLDIKEILPFKEVTNTIETKGLVMAFQVFEKPLRAVTTSETSDWDITGLIGRLNVSLCIFSVIGKRKLFHSR